jgi:hypothetical protein
MDGNQLIKAFFKINPDEKVIGISGLEQADNFNEYRDLIKFIDKPFMENTPLTAFMRNFPDKFAKY